MKNLFYLFAFVGFAQLISCSATKKTAPSEGPIGMTQKHFSNEQIQADALALANINCEWGLAKYYAGLQENNNKLQREEKALLELKTSFDQKMKIRYMQIDELEKKFTKALEKAQKRLSACQKLEEVRKMEEEKAKAENQ
ncbi:MAG: hypothetical protein L3J66_12110 [Bacteroidales bacterium]|nr:hypothetical protein [Bacteroidales bacterium]